MPKEVKWAISIGVGLALLALGWKVYFVLVTLHVIICGLLIIVIMLQSGEAADLAGAFGGAGSQTAFGPRGAATFLTKATTWCAVMFLFTSMALTMHVSTRGGGGGARSILQQFSKPVTQQKAPAPTVPAPSPFPLTPSQPVAPPPSK